MTTGPVFTLANQLTLLRMLLIPGFVLLVVYGEFGWALAVFLFAGVTDALDGLIARQTGQKSELGAWLDPAADKLLLVTTFIVLTLPNVGLVNRIPIWLTILVISRDVGIVLTVAVVNLASGPRTFRPSQLGKVATAWFIFTCVVVMFYNWRAITSPVVGFFIWTSLAITLASGIDYVWRIGRGLR
ncbi:MAG TPA: CDP-alcohol phosphatidyltransferase family protein [Vicinamibacterales bacterium]|nr:CDP-alcohol phosphatidyltransferase family protein [Vicinamibacterales bacterium]